MAVKLSLSFFSFVLVLAVDELVDEGGLLGKSLSFTLTCDLGKRKFNGIVHTIERLIPIKGAPYAYKVTLVPSFYLLIEHHDCRAYYNKSVLDITQFWFDYFGFNNIDFSQLQSTYPAMTYCVQFNESVFDFLSRLFSQYGIYYFFEFDDAAHTLVLADNVSSYYENNMLLKIGEHANYFIKDFCHSFDPQPMNIKMISSRSYPGRKFAPQSTRQLIVVSSGFRTRGLFESCS